jgi:hypothetical protein
VWVARITDRRQTGRERPLQSPRGHQATELPTERVANRTAEVVIGTVHQDVATVRRQVTLIAQRTTAHLPRGVAIEIRLRLLIDIRAPGRWDDN